MAMKKPLKGFTAKSEYLRAINPWDSWYGKSEVTTSSSSLACTTFKTHFFLFLEFIWFFDTGSLCVSMDPVLELASWP